MEMGKGQVNYTWAKGKRTLKMNQEFTMDFSTGLTDYVNIMVSVETQNIFPKGAEFTILCFAIHSCCGGSVTFSLRWDSPAGHWWHM